MRATLPRCRTGSPTQRDTISDSIRFPTVPLPARAAFREHALLQVLWFGTLAALLVAVRLLNDGTLIYTLDDPYIHLAVAEGILQGTYGVNPGEVSSPASSLLWPLILVPFVALGWGTWAPLALNAIFGALTAFVVLRRLQRTLSIPRFSPLRMLLAIGILLAANAPGLAFTGMEHSLQVLLALLLVDGLLGFPKEPLRLWHWAAIALGPWVRYENLGLTLAAAMFLIGTGQRKKLAWAVGLCGTGLLAFSGFLLANGLHVLPSSALQKTGMVGESRGLWRSLSDHVVIATSSTRGVALIGLILVLFTLASLRPARDQRQKLCLCLALAGLLHVFFGIYGWFHRYECYVLGSLALGSLVLAATQLQGTKNSLRPLWPALLGLGFLGSPYAIALADIPKASHNIYEQQFQVHRFLTEHWKAPAAVNDIGWPTFQNEHYILDFVGLSSMEVHHARKSGKDAAWMDRLAREHGIQLIVIYESWFPGRPKEWVKLADLSLSGPRMSVSSNRVSFFAVDKETAPPIRARLQEFQKTLPDGIPFHISKATP